MKVYFSLTLKLGTSFVLSEQGQQMLPKLWDHIQMQRIKRKKEMLAALLFLLYNQERSCFGIKQFQKKLCLNISKLSSCVEFVRKLFGFSPSVGGIENSIADCISELSKIVLNNSDVETQKGISKLARRLAKVVHAKHWATDTNKCYVEQVSCACTVIAAHYFSSEKRDRKLKSGRRSHFRYNSINLDQLAKYVEISKRRLFIWIKTLQKALFAFKEQMLVKPGCVHDHRDIGLVLVDILDYIDLDLASDDTEDEKDFVDEQFLRRKELLTKLLYTFLNTSDTRDRNFNMQEFAEFLQQNLKEIQNESTEDCSVGLCRKKNVLSVGKHQFHFHHIELLKELMAAGCSLKELNSEKDSHLIKTYLEKGICEDSDLEDLEDDEDIDMYIKTPKEIESLEKFEHSTKF